MNNLKAMTNYDYQVLLYHAMKDDPNYRTPLDHLGYGPYLPFGSHATVIYEYLEGNGLINKSGKVTDNGWKAMQQFEAEHNQP